MTKPSHALVNRNHVRAGLLALALGSLSLSAHAIEWSKNSDFLWSPKGNVTNFNIGTGSGTTVLAKPIASGFEMGGAKALPWEPKPADYGKWAAWKASITPKEVAKSLVRPGSIVGLVAGELALAGIKQLLDEACVRLSGGAKELKPGAVWDECVPASVKELKEWQVPEVGTWYSSLNGACTSYLSYWNNKYRPTTGQIRQYTGVNEPANMCQYRIVSAQDGSVVNPESYTPLEVRTRPGTPDDSTQWKESTPEAVQQKLETKIGEWTQADFLYGFGKTGGPNAANAPSVKMLNEIMNQGNTITSEGPLTVTGPSSLTGTPTVREYTNSAGEKIRETTNTTYNFTYNNTDNSVKRTESTTVTSSNLTTGKTETTTETKDDERNDCEKNPESLACATTDVPTGEIPRETRTISYTPEDGGFGGHCPADVYITTHGQTMKAWDWQKGCSMIQTYMRPVVIALCAFGALVILIPGGRSS